MLQLRLLIAAAGVVALLGAGAWAYVRGHGNGWADRDGECRVEVQTIRDELLEAERQAQAERGKGRILADRLAAATLEYERRIAENAAKFRSEIEKRARADRVALDRSLVELLNRATPIREYRDGQAVAPQPDLATADATAAGDRDRLTGASERSVARWIVGAQEMYETCRSRLGALQAWARDVSQP